MKLEHFYGYTPILSLANLSNLTFAPKWCVRQIWKVLKENYVHRYDTTIKKEVSKNSAKLPWPDSRVFTSRNRGPSPTSFVLVAHFPWFFSILPSSASTSNGVSCDQCTVPWIGANFSPTWHWAPFFLALRPSGHQTWQQNISQNFNVEMPEKMAAPSQVWLQEGVIVIDIPNRFSQDGCHWFLIPMSPPSLVSSICELTSRLLSQT